MPEPGERKTKGGVTGEWDGTTWRRVAEAPSAGPEVGARKVKDGITGEWDGTTWRRVAAPEADAEPEKPTNWMGGVSALAATGAAALPAAKRIAEQVATSPTLGRTAGLLAKRLAPLNIVKQGYDVATGKQGIVGAATDAALGEGARRLVGPAAKFLQRAATPVAGMSVPMAAGGLAGVAGTAGFLGALQHDANRTVPMDYTKRNLTEDIARVLGSSGATDAQMDDPTHPAFRADDSATVAAAPRSVSSVVQAFFGRRGEP
jgi:hypothetical protein